MTSTDVYQSPHPVVDCYFRTIIAHGGDCSPFKIAQGEDFRYTASDSRRDKNGGTMRVHEVARDSTNRRKSNYELTLDDGAAQVKAGRWAAGTRAFVGAVRQGRLR